MPQATDTADLVAAVREAVTDDVRKPHYQGNENEMAGHCYVASEALYHLLGGAANGWCPEHVRHEGEPHWYLRHKPTGGILDATGDQFTTPPPYDKGIGKGFLTKDPSARARVVMSRAMGVMVKSFSNVSVGDEPAPPAAAPETCAKCPRKAHARVLHGKGEHTPACWQHAGQIRRERGTSFKGWHRLTKAEDAPHVALVLAYDGHGRLLLGKRNDNGRWTLPGGHLNPGEDPEAGASRELREETGLVAPSLHRVFVRPNPPGGPVLHVFSTSVAGYPHGGLDPDRECSEWQWHDVGRGVPPEVWDNLAGPPDDLNVVRQIHPRGPGAAMMKSEDRGAAGLLGHHDHRERQLAVLSGALSPHELVHALLDPHPEVQEAARQHQAFGPHVQRIANLIHAARAQRKGITRG